MKKLFMVFGFAAIVGMISSPAFAQPFSAAMCDDGLGADVPCQAGGIPEVYEAINYVFTSAGVASPAYTSNVDANVARFTGPDSYWKDLGGGTSSSFAAVSITAANMNTLGVFKFADAGSKVKVVDPQTGFKYLGDGTMADPFPGGMNPYSGEDFGFSLDSVGSGGPKTWYSDPTMNSDGIDHMISYYLPELAGTSVYVEVDDDATADPTDKKTIKLSFAKDTWLLAWEDRADGHPSFDSDYNDTIFLVTRVTPVPEPMSMILLGGGLAGLVGARKKKMLS